MNLSLKPLIYGAVILMGLAGADTVFARDHHRDRRHDRWERHHHKHYRKPPYRHYYHHHYRHYHYPPGYYYPPYYGYPYRPRVGVSFHL